MTNCPTTPEATLNKYIFAWPKYLKYEFKTKG